jgi:hypothetical protein
MLWPVSSCQSCDHQARMVVAEHGRWLGGTPATAMGNGWFSEARQGWRENLNRTRCTLPH